MKKSSAMCLVVASFMATQVLAGNLTINGNLTVNSNLTVNGGLAAPSITLDGVTETSWPASIGSLPLQGYKYVIVAEGTNDVQRGNNLRAAYATATTLSPTSSSRVAVIVPPGSYNLGTTGLMMNTSYIDLIGLVPAQMTSKQVFTNSAGNAGTKTVANVQCPFRIYASASAGTLLQSVDYIRIESVVLQNTGTGPAYAPSIGGINTVLRHVEALSMSVELEYAGQYADCVGGDGGFGGGDSYNVGSASGTFIDCVAGDGSFGGDAQPGQGSGQANGTFVGCTAGNSSFGTASDVYGVFIGCVSGDDSR